MIGRCSECGVITDAELCPSCRRARERPDAERLAQAFHEAYERLAPSFGYETRKDSAVAWVDVPEPNRSLMIAVAGEVLDGMGDG